MKAKRKKRKRAFILSITLKQELQMLIPYRFFMGISLFSIVPYCLIAQEGNDSEPVNQLLHKNQAQQAKVEKIDRVILGEIIRINVPSASYCKDSDNLKRMKSEIATWAFNDMGYEIEVAPGEIMLDLGIKYKYAELNKKDREMISDEWDSYSHPGLERFYELPLHLFINVKGELKDEGEEVIIYYNDKQTHERIKVILTIRTADIVTMSDLFDCSKVHYIVRNEGYRNKMKSYLDEYNKDPKK